MTQRQIFGWTGPTVNPLEGHTPYLAVFDAGPGVVRIQVRGKDGIQEIGVPPIEMLRLAAAFVRQISDGLILTHEARTVAMANAEMVAARAAAE